MEDKDASLPDGLKNLRACLRCHLIKTTEQVSFLQHKIPDPFFSNKVQKRRMQQLLFFSKL